MPEEYGGGADRGTVQVRTVRLLRFLFGDGVLIIYTPRRCERDSYQSDALVSAHTTLNSI